MQLYDIISSLKTISFVFDERRPQASVPSQLSICCKFYEKLDPFFKCKRVSILFNFIVCSSGVSSIDFAAASKSVRKQFSSFSCKRLAILLATLAQWRRDLLVQLPPTIFRIEWHDAKSAMRTFRL